MTTAMSDTTVAAQRKPIEGKSVPVAGLLGILPGGGHWYVNSKSRAIVIMTALVLLYVTVAVKGFWLEVFAPGFSYFLLAMTVLLHLWSIWDAISLVRGQALPIGLAILISVVAFGLIGQDVTDVKIVKLLTEFTDVSPILRQIAWPWPAAVGRDIETTESGTPFDIPCKENERNVAELSAGEPSIMVSPTCGEPSASLGTNVELGTMITVTGSGFAPGEVVTMWWEDDFGQEYRPRFSGDYVRTEAAADGTFEVEFPVPPYLLENPQLGEDPHTIIARQEREVGQLKFTQNFRNAADRMVETIYLGLFATALGIVFAVPVSFLAARNLMSGSRVTMAIYFIVRSLLNAIRSVEPIIWAVMFILWVGLGPFAGVLALMFHTVAALGKLYSESIESIDPGPIEAIQATGANRLQTIMYAIVPQIIPPFVSFTFYRWDINVRMSTIIGIVGGGGIGFLLIQWIRLTDYDAAGIAVWMIALVVATLDYVSAQIRADFT